MKILRRLFFALRAAATVATVVLIGICIGGLGNTVGKKILHWILIWDSTPAQKATVILVAIGGMIGFLWGLFWGNVR